MLSSGIRKVIMFAFLVFTREKIMWYSGIGLEGLGTRMEFFFCCKFDVFTRRGVGCSGLGGLLGRSVE